jgi:hypothetical protein
LAITGNLVWERSREKGGGMNRRVAKRIARVSLLLLFPIIAPCQGHAQSISATLSGTVTGPLVGSVANANVTLKNLVTGQAIETQTDSKGHYSAANLPAAAYEVSVSAEGFVRTVTGITLTTGAH